MMNDVICGTSKMVVREQLQCCTLHVCGCCQPRSPDVSLAVDKTQSRKVVVVRCSMSLHIYKPSRRMYIAKLNKH